MNSGDQTTIAVPTDTQINPPPAIDVALLPTRSNDQLLEMVRSAPRARQIQKNIFIVLCVASIVFALSVVWTSKEPLLWIPLILLLGFIAEPLFFAWRGRKYPLALRALSQRSETRAIGVLLDQEDYRPNSAAPSKPLTAHRALLLELLPYLKPDRFRRLTDAQINRLCDLAFFPHAELSAAVQDALARCGEERALRALRQPGRVALQSALQEEQKTRFATALAAIAERVAQCAQAQSQPSQNPH